MVLDTSAVIAILQNEPEAAALAAAIEADPERLISTFSVLEAAVVIERRKGEVGRHMLDRMLGRIAAKSEPLTTEHLAAAREAWARFGKSRHDAGLNLGDCCSYALSRCSGQPLLYKGDDFALTDVARVKW